MTTFLAIISLFLASAVPAQDKPSVANPTAACGPHGTRFDVKLDHSQQTLAQPETGKALVYVVEKQKARGWKEATTRVGLDGAWIGANRGDSYFFFSTAPGEHHLCADWETGFWERGTQPGKPVSLAKFNAEVGKVYYFRARTMTYGVLELEAVDSDETQLLIASSAHSTSYPKK